MRRIGWFFLPAALMFALLPGAAAAKTSAGPNCGDTITTSITLTANLTCTTATNGLNVGHNGIVINLNGHSITGPGGSYGTVGIQNIGFRHVTVKNGTIRNFSAGYLSSGAVSETVTKVHVIEAHQSYAGIELGNGTGGIYSHDTVTRAGYGFLVSYETGAKFTGNTLRANAYGADEELSQHDTWTGNHFSYSSGNGFNGNGSTPILIGNVATHNTSYGFNVLCNASGSAVLKNNTANNNGLDGIYALQCYSTGHHATLRGNKANFNGASGIDCVYDTAAVIQSNVTKSNQSNGVTLTTSNTYFPAGLSSNVSSGNHGYGYYADDKVHGTGDTGSANTSGLFYNVSG